MKFLWRFLVVMLPWPLRRWVLVHGYGYSIHPTARIGWAWIFPDQLTMAEHSSIGHLTVAIHLHRVVLGPHATIGRNNWITGYPVNGPRHFTHLSGRDPALILGAHSAITKHHHCDCTARIEIGAFTTIAGYGSQLLTHSIDLVHNRQEAAAIRIGDYCFVGTAVVLLGGSCLPDRSVLGAKALLNKAHDKTDWLYAGVPAVPVKPLPPGAAYFTRSSGFVI